MQSKTLVTIVGEIVDISDVQTFSGSKFKKRQFIVKDGDDSKYPSYFPCVLKNEDVGLIDGWKVKDLVEVQAYVNGNRWQKKDANGKIERTMYFLELGAKKISEPDQGAGSPEEPESSDADGLDDPDDMPF